MSTHHAVHGPTRRQTLLGLAAAGSVGALAACGGGDAGEDVSDKTKGAMEGYDVGQTFRATEPLTFTTLFSDHPNYPFNPDWLFWSALSETTNVSLEATIVPMSDYPQKRSLVVSAGDAPVIIPKTYPGEEAPFVASGVVLAVSDYTDLMPHYRQKVQEWGMETELETLLQDDGKYYVLPGLHENLWPDYTILMRTDLLEENGIPEPTTWDEFADALRALKAAYPDVIPFSDRYEGQNFLNQVGTGHGTVSGWGYGEGIVHDGDTFQFAAATPEHEDFVAYLNGLVAEGLMDPESFTQTDDQATQKLYTGQSFAISGNSQDPPKHRAAMDSSLGAGTYEIRKIVLPAGPAGNLVGGTRLENGIMISAAAAERDDFQALVQFVDWLWYSDEGREFAKWGVEGTTFTKDADGTRRLTPEVSYLDLNPEGTKDLQTEYGFMGGNFSYGGTTELLRSMMNEEEVAWQEAMASKEQVEPVPPHPYTAVEREQVTLLATPLKDYVAQGELQFALGQRDVAQYDAFVQELEGRGMSRYLDMVNQAAERV
ncbi:ABC transporter substrate-binding protein [Kineococcus terrestris]|uniref:ABC transporter substrate-binding protein n=1 Tax=Kineococcus terrestris TaxID=2044856 RepID=UPI0034DB7001